MECHGSGDERLLLLCDRCDGAAHTFCVGLGTSIPRGDWFCRACQGSVAAENSDNYNEENELVQTSDTEHEDGESDQDEDTILRSIVASPQSGNRCPRRSRAQIPISRPRLSNVVPRRRARSASTQGISRRLSDQQRGLNDLEIQLSSHMNGSARTIRQQCGLQERIQIMRTNWGQIQTGNLQFVAVGRQAIGSSRSVVSGKSSVLEDNKSKPGTISPQGEREVEQAWQMMSRARSQLNAGVSNSSEVSSNKKLSDGTLHYPSPFRASVLTNQNVNNRNQNFNRKNDDSSSNIIGRSKSRSRTLEIFMKKDKEDLNPNASGASNQSSNEKCGEARSSIAARLKSRTFENAPKKNKKHMIQNVSDIKNKFSNEKSGEASSSVSARLRKSDQKDMVNTSTRNAALPARMMKSRDCQHEDVPHSRMEFKPRRMDKCVERSDIESPDMSKKISSNAKIHVVTSADSKRQCDAASTSNEGMKVHLTELVKKQIWPFYIAEGLGMLCKLVMCMTEVLTSIFLSVFADICDLFFFLFPGKEQFKQIARAAVHTLLSLCLSESESLSCSHLGDRGNSPVDTCCGRCFDTHVEIAVKTAKDRVVPI